MTIFDIKPYSHWKQAWERAFLLWSKGSEILPHTALRMELQEQIIAQQKRLLSHMERENCALRAAHALVLEEYLNLHAASMALHRLVTQTVQNAAISHETDVLRPNTPAPPPTTQEAPFL